jgi:hypothetical protein
MMVAAAAAPSNSLRESFIVMNLALDGADARDPAVTGSCHAGGFSQNQPQERRKQAHGSFLGLGKQHEKDADSGRGP